MSYETKKLVIKINIEKYYFIACKFDLRNEMTLKVIFGDKRVKKKFK